MPRPQFSVAIIAVGFLACKPLGASAPATPAATFAATERQQLAVVLASDRPDAEKLSACKRLALIGNADSVPALAPLLSDAELSHAARLGLEAIPDPAADEALRGGLTQVKGDLLVGVLNSIGARRDRQAVAGLGRLLGDNAPAIASAAAAALGKIAGPEAAHLARPTRKLVPKPWCAVSRRHLGRHGCSCSSYSVRWEARGHWRPCRLLQRMMTRRLRTSPRVCWVSG
jgi:hypothetical protein